VAHQLPRSRQPWSQWFSLHAGRRCSLRYLVGLDLGTSGAKAGFFEPDGTLVSLWQEEYRFETPRPLWSEIEPQVVWEKACICLQRARKQADIAPSEVAAVGLSVIGETVMAVDPDNAPVYPAIESMDARDGGYQSAIDEWQSALGAERIFEITSYPLSALPSANKILWLRGERPEVFERAARFVTFQDYTLHRLSGEFAIDYSMASRTMLFDVARKRWSPQLLSVIGLSADRLSAACPASTVVGWTTAEAAEATGLRSGVPVVAGAHDQACASLGVGIVGEGIAMDGTGSVEAVVVPASQPVTDPAMLRLGQGSQCHVRGDVYLVIGFHLAAGSLVRWYRDELALAEQARAVDEGQDVYDLITEQAAQSPPGANGVLVLPHFRGSGTGVTPPLNPLSKGVIVGLTLSHSRRDLARAIFEGITLETRLILDSMENSGISIDELRVTGGGAKSPFWLQVKADITQKRIVVPDVTEASLLGAAMLAGVGEGTYTSLEDAVSQVVRLGRTYIPNEDTAQVYDEQFRVYRKIYPSMLDIFDDISQLVNS
jgi:xylulokinase